MSYNVLIHGAKTHWGNKNSSYRREDRSPGRKYIARFVTVQHTTMCQLHMVIDMLPREHPHTPPTNMRRALRTSHVVAASVLLDQDFATRALLDILVTIRPSLQQPLLSLRILMYLPFLTAEPAVVLSTGHANGHRARSALENPVPKIGLEGVEFRTVGSGAVPEFIRVAVEVVEEGRFQQALKLGTNEELLYDGERDRETTLPLVGQARQRELFGIGSGEEEVANAAVAISVATG